MKYLLLSLLLLSSCNTSQKSSNSVFDQDKTYLSIGDDLDDQNDYMAWLLYRPRTKVEVLAKVGEPVNSIYDDHWLWLPTKKTDGEEVKEVDLANGGFFLMFDGNGMTKGIIKPMANAHGEFDNLLSLRHKYLQSSKSL